jgi:hypothetical protein
LSKYRGTTRDLGKIIESFDLLSGCGVMGYPVAFINPDLTFNVFRLDYFRDWAVPSIDVEVYKKLAFNFRLFGLHFEVVDIALIKN